MVPPGGKPCPPEVRLHGTENLLHRATAEGSELVVSQLLECGDRNLSARNNNGQSAVHLAAFFGHDSVLKCLLNHGANANILDSSGYTPLHFACQGNKTETLKILLELGRANVTIRNQTTGWVPLHEAAFHGYEGCAAMLLEHKAPPMPRTPENETPADLARHRGHHSVAALIEKAALTEEPVATEANYLHDAISREAAIALLKENAIEDGTFLIRKSQKRRGVFVLSVFHEFKTCHLEIVKQGIYYFLEQGPYMISLDHLVDHYMRFSDGLPCTLRNPVAPSDVAPRRPQKPQKPQPAPRPPKRDLSAPRPSNLKPIDAKKPYENNDTLRRVRHSKDNIPVESITLGKHIGEGEFGSVREGFYKTDKGEERKIAIKELNSLEKSQAEDFLREAEVMMQLDHQCVVQLIGMNHETFKKSVQ